MENMGYSTINPADLHSNGLFGFEPFECPPEELSLDHLNQVDSAVDLTSQWGSANQEPIDQFLNMSESPTATNTPSPPIFSNTNSPGDLFRDHSHTNSPEAAGIHGRETATSPSSDAWNAMYPSPGAILIPQEKPTAMVSLRADKVKTRAETQIKMQLIMEPLDAEYIGFPRKTLAKPKHFASEEERDEMEAKGIIVYMDALLVCAVAVEKQEDKERALRRAAGIEKVPRRSQGVALSDMEKDDPAHPQNGGEVLICEGCKERERKRYDRKKKRTEDEEEFSKYENERVIMINEKEFKKWKEVDADQNSSPRARQVDFAMRIACYCRHQEEKTPAGYRVIFTFTDSRNTLLAQHMSEVFHITDDHKNKDAAPDPNPRPLTIPQPYMTTQYPYSSNVVDTMGQYPLEGQYATSLGPYSQPATPVMPNFQAPISPMDTAFGQSIAAPATQPSRQAAAPFAPSVSTTTAQYTRHQRGQSYYDPPMLSSMGSHLPRPQSLDNFNFNFSTDAQFPATSQDQYFASAPQSAVSTPINLSRPASPTWEQGPQKKGKTLRCVYFYVDE